MAKFGESYCWTIKDDPSVCPYIKPGEEHLLVDLERRNREKCIECEELRNDLKKMADEKGNFFHAFQTILDESLKREQTIIRYGRSLEVREEMLDMLAHLSNSLKLVLDVDEILYKGLVAFTMGSSFGFNRAIALLAGNKKLKGYFAIGPKDQEEAYAIWRELNEKNLTVQDLLRFSPDMFRKEKEKFTGILERLEFNLSEQLFKNVFEAEMILRVSSEDDMPSTLGDFYRGTPFWVIPFFSHLRRPLGVILLDNFLTKKEVSSEEMRVMEIFAAEISLALERGLTYEELEEKVGTLEEANVKLKEHQELIMKLRAEASIGEMVLQLTHSFKNPVIAIAGLARVLNKKAQSEEDIIPKYTDAILEEALKLEKTLKDFVNFVKTTYLSGKSPLDINKVVELLYQEKRAKGKLQGVHFHLNLASNLPMILGNEYQLYNCIENLVYNSIEAMPEGGELYLETEAENGFVTLSIRDTGPGISDEVMERLFQPFFTTKTIGSGLGLYTSKEIIEKMSGNISVSCEREKGCRVTIMLPILKKGVSHEQDFSGG